MPADCPWPSRRLAEVAQIQTGAAKGKTTSADGVELPYLRVANVQDGYVDLREIKTIWVEPKQVERYSLRSGDVLFTEGGDADKLGRGCVWQGQIEPCLHQNHIFAVRTDRTCLLPEFLSLYAASASGRSYFLECAKQTTNLASVNSSQLKDFPVAIPPLGEQRKITTILSSVDDAIQTTQAVIDQLGVVKKALMAELLTRGIPGRHTKFRQTEIGEVPEAWEVTPLSTVAYVQTGAAKGKPVARGVEIPYLRVANVQDGHVDLSEVKTLTVARDAVARYALQVGDVLFTEGGDADKLGRGCVWMGQINPCLHQNHVFAVRMTTNRLLPAYLAFWAASPRGRTYFMDSAKQTTNLASINSTQLKAFPVAIPPISEQDEIVSALGTIESRMTIEQGCYDNSAYLKRSLMSALLTGDLRVHPAETPA